MGKEWCGSCQKWGPHGCEYHEFEVLRDTEEVQVERCKRCPHRVTYNKTADGQIDNVRYLKDHLRDFCQSTGPTSSVFLSVYGPEAYERSRRLKAQEVMKESNEKEAWDQGVWESKESLKLWKTLESRGYTRREILQAIDKI